MVEKLEIRFFPDEEIVDDFQCARAQYLDHVLLTDKAARGKDHAQLAAGLVLNFHCRLKVSLFDFAVVQQHLAQTFSWIVGAGTNDPPFLEKDLFDDAAATEL